MPLSKFEMFVAVARQRNLTRAASDLHISQPALTQQLKHLQDQYRTRLYRRTAKGIEVTAAGAMLLDFARKTVDKHRALKQKLSSADACEKTASLTLGGSPSTSKVLLPSLMVQFKAMHPNVSLRLITSNREEIVQRIKSGEIAIAVINNPAPACFLATEPFCTEEVVAFVSTAHPLAERKSASLEELAHARLIIRDSKGANGLAEQILHRLKKRGIDPVIDMRCGSPDAIKEAVRQQFGVGVLFRSTLEADAREGEFKTLEIAGTRLIGKTVIAYHRHRPLTSAAERFLQLLRRKKPESPHSARSRQG